MAEKNVNIGSSLTKFTFSDDSGEVIAHFCMNPADVRIVERAREVSEYFKSRSGNFDGSNAAESMAKYDRELTEKVNYLLGYDASKTLFCRISATAVMDDGRFFAKLVMDTIAQNLKEELNRRFEKFKAVSKYTAKYE